MAVIENAASVARSERDMNSLSLLTVGVLLATVTMTFAAMIVVFVYRSEGRVFWGHIEVPRLLWITTAILVASSVTLEQGRRLLRENEQAAAFQKFSLTAGLGVVFLLGQIGAWFEVLHSGIVLAKNAHSWFIFLFVSLHGLHILLGLGALAFLVMRTRESASGPRYLMKTRALANGISLFWHYLDFLWLVLFGLLLTWRR